MTQKDLKAFEASLEPFSDLLDNFDYPSTHTFTRYLEAWNPSLHGHFPIIHFPTFRLNDCSPELVLAMAALGALQVLEEHKSRLLYEASRSIVFERLRRQAQRAQRDRARQYPETVEYAGEYSFITVSPTRGDNTTSTVDTQNTLLLLLIYSSWGRDAALVAETFEYREPLLRCVKEDGLSECCEDCEQDWVSWAWNESKRRSKLLAFCFFNIHTLVYHHAPGILAKDFDIQLPCTEEEWNASDESQWRFAHKDISHNQSGFGASLASILTSDGNVVDLSPPPTPFGSMVLLHGIIQRIYLIRQLATDHELEDQEINKIQ
jgi:hypothetical protein